MATPDITLYFLQASRSIRIAWLLEELGLEYKVYLIEKYDKEGKMGGKDEALRNRIRTFIHAAEGTFMVHALAITYARWFSPQTTESGGDLKKLEEGLAINVGKDLDWLNAELEGNRFIAGRM